MSWGYDPLCDDPRCSCAKEHIERLRSRNAELEAALRQIAEPWKQGDKVLSPSPDEIARAVLREEKEEKEEK